MAKRKPMRREKKRKEKQSQTNQDWHRKDWQMRYRMLNVVLSSKEPLWDWDKDKTTDNNG